MLQENNGFINSEALTKWVRWFLYVQILVAIISLISGNMEYKMLIDYENGVYTTEEQVVADGVANDIRQGIIGLVYLVVFIVSCILIMKWIYRANYNARQLGAKDMTFTPGWSVGWYFIPIFTLWKPYQAMKEIWKASINPDNWNEVTASPILSWWWFFWLTNKFLGQAVIRMSLRAKEIPELKAVNLAYQASDVVSIVLALVTMALVNGIYQAQVAHANNQSQGDTE
jgi:hypothetical protein